MKPDKPGIWHSRDGETVYAFMENGRLTVDVLRPGKGYDRTTFPGSLPGDDWLPAEPPTFPELPPKPRLVLTKTLYGTQWSQERDGFVSPLDIKYWLPYESVRVVPHPDNDPEAVRLIEEAKQ